MTVAMFHNYREERQPSMSLYAHRLGEALQRLHVPVQRVRVDPLLPDALRRGRFVEKADAFWGRFVRYPRVCGAVQADVFHLCDHGEAFLLHRLDAGRTVVTCHDLMLLLADAGRLPSPFRAPFATKILRLSLREMRRAAAVIAVSEQTRRDLVSIGGIEEEKITVVHSGLNYPIAPDPSLRAAARRRLALGERPVLLHVGSNSFYKNVETVLRVLSQLRRDGVDAVLLKAGQAFSPAQHKLIDDLRLGQAVSNVGPVSQATLLELYQAADALLFPSLYEGFGWPVLEAMAAGLPVVTSDAGALTEVAGGAALHAPALDSDELACHTARVLTDAHLARELRARGLARASQFHWDKTAAEVLAIYERVAGQPLTNAPRTEGVA